MKQLTSYNRAAGYLNKLFDLLNQHYFENALSRPTITIQSTPKAYGHFSMRPDTWVSAVGCSHEINIGAGTLSRPIEDICATLLHEMIHLPPVTFCGRISVGEGCVRSGRRRFCLSKD